ncbi:MAG TPA: BMP family ABC transporter substrate-binding protein [candidate division Zixibacteria bacterium]|nr:BMP family ABC transporter substrate-binding protein [candidate division Zixibacteria bacterium]
MLAHGITFDDLAFLQSCKAGLERAISHFDIVAEYDLDTLQDNYYERIIGFAEGDFDLIVAIGFMWNDAVLQAAGEYPEISFILVDAELSTPMSNVVSIVFDVDEAAYPLGYLSACWAVAQDTANPAVGYVGAMEIPQIMQFIQPYLNGVARFNSENGASVAHHGGFTGNFVDYEGGGSIADSIIAIGADIIFGVGRQAGNGALHTAKELGKSGIGVDVDQFYSYPEVSDILISSAIKALDNALFAVISSYMDDALCRRNLRRQPRQ